MLFGGAGNDLLVGGTGDDLLFGGAGTDIFAIAPGEGTNVILDFESGQDLIGLSGGLSLGQMYIVQSGANTVIGTFEGEVLSVVLNADANQFVESTFLSI